MRNADGRNELGRDVGVWEVADSTRPIAEVAIFVLNDSYATTAVVGGVEIMWLRAAACRVNPTFQQVSYDSNGGRDPARDGYFEGLRLGLSPSHLMRNAPIAFLTSV
jgi:hypothetical protein